MKNTTCQVNLKLNVYHAVIITKLLYGLETLQCTNKIMGNIDVFQMKGLRKVLGIPPTLIDRTWTNATVFEEQNKITGQSHISLPIRPASDINNDKKTYHFYNILFVQDQQTH